jgi:cytidine deaminase
MDKELIKKAREVSENAYVPYSGFKVGAALRTASGKIFTGCNVENSSYGLTNCAERTAVFKAVSEGEKDFKEIAVFVDSDILFSPCGACRQVLKEFNGEMQVTIVSGNRTIETTVNELLPHGFHL